MIQLVYIAGPYRAPTGWGIDQNIQRARELGAEVARLGALGIVPHANTAHYDGIVPDEFWLAADLVLLKRCDALLMMENWKASKGAILEHATAVNSGIPVHYSLDSLKYWLSNRP